MGYLTRYTVVNVPMHTRHLVESAVAEIIGYDPFVDTVKWYEWRNTCEEVARKLGPDVIFTIRGEGEEAGDVWEAHFCDDHEPQIYSMPEWSAPPPMFVKREG